MSTNLVHLIHLIKDGIDWSGVDLSARKQRKHMELYIYTMYTTSRQDIRTRRREVLLHAVHNFRSTWGCTFLYPYNRFKHIYEVGTYKVIMVPCNGTESGCACFKARSPSQKGRAIIIWPTNLGKKAGKKIGVRSAAPDVTTSLK